MPTAPARTVVIDTDPGIDDAVAILLALKSAEFDVRGITTVAGNIGIATTTRNAGRILALESRADIPVVSGAAGPLSRKGFDTTEIHGNDGLGGVAFPEPLARVAGNDAAAWLAKLLDELPAGSLDILALGPLTNIARLVQDHPASAKRIGRVIAMGGAVHEPGNIGPRAEFNIAADPEAAEIVFGAGLNFTLIPLDVTRKVRATRDYTAALQAAGVPAAKSSGELIDAYFQSTTGGESRPLHDPCVMLLALDESLFGCETLKISVDTGATRDAGALTIDDEKGAAISVAMKVDGEGGLKLLFERLVG
ncbi:nucleoside hydrolase [Mesorhizobium sp. YR577]|uniref:nucleoside hydrolase n=1 Tax=Mesorhizobium sp. YR577 TaxID=1884373 RepID=UPI0008F04687|nr:nucleoside hydrolase [Mesorhizobium sp. YR577]SFT71583.1 purine nucleosidase/pyrimidine-specific ribonucleoside hydrolase [Mesorhizobium sp. YR577]